MKTLGPSGDSRSPVTFRNDSKPSTMRWTGSFDVFRSPVFDSPVFDSPRLQCGRRVHRYSKGGVKTKFRAVRI